ncbi:MAG: hypothetical protein KME30_13940 [Iphinoe sp. HA4291-MV1]|jgi:hypothetical protein|nr:hypothetical protein [Iphinoe sp. HA4291-MV1]
MRTFHINGEIPQNNHLLSISGDVTSYPNVIAFKPMLFTSLFTKAETLIFTFISKSLWFTDILFSPTASPDADPQSLGLLGRIAASASLLEPFRNPPSKTEVRNCILKLFSVCAEFQRKAKRESTSLPEDNLPRLWILAPSASAALLDSFGARLELENWSSGIYFLPKSFRTGIVAINQLPVTNETL